MKGALTLGIALVVIFSCLYGMIFLINRMLISLPIEVIAKVTNMTTIPSMITGCVVGLLMGNSSVTESMMTPFVGTGIVELEQVSNKFMICFADFLAVSLFQTRVLRFVFLMFETC